MSSQKDIDDAVAIMQSLVPALKNVEDKSFIITFVSIADMLICENRFGDKRPQALALYSLHLMFLDGAFKQTTDLNDYSRRIASFSLSGEFSQSFGAINASGETGLNQTPWGRMYSILNKKKGGGFGLMASANRRGCP